MRLYSFTNMYTSGIHAGIQTAHVVHEMMRKYQKKHDARVGDLAYPASDKYKNLLDWADNHKTIIVKCAGYHEDLVRLYDELKEYSAHFNLPLGRWRESKAALNNAQTAVAIVVPKEIYSLEPQKQVLAQFDLPPDQLLANIIHRYRMAT